MESASRVEEAQDWSTSLPSPTPIGKSTNVWDTPGISTISSKQTLSSRKHSTESVEESKLNRSSNIEVSGRRLGQPRTSSLPPPPPPSSSTITAPSNSERTTRSQAEALQRLKEQRMNRLASAQPRKVVNYNTLGPSSS
jgi:hypothetical protein